MKKFTHFAILGIMALTLVACMDKEDTPPYFAHIDAVHFNKQVLSLPERQTFQLEIVFTPEDAGNKKVTWYNTNPDVATVSATGLITAKTSGETTIGVETADMRRTTEVKLTVTPFITENPITKIDLSASLHAFEVTDQPFTITSTVTPSDATITTLEWSSSDKFVASVSQDGVVTPVSHGNAVITAKAIDGSKKTAECKVTVNGIKDKNYDIVGGINASDYYKLIYYPVNVVVTLPDGTSATQTWLDRNLGATKVATSSTDYQAYGSLFQWSRKADGHEQTAYTSSTEGSLLHQVKVNSPVAERKNAGTTDFITASKAPYDWSIEASTRKDGLWGGLWDPEAISNNLSSHAVLEDEAQSNNPCPEGYRIPSPNEAMAMAGAVVGESVTYNKTVNIGDPMTMFANHALHIPLPGNVNHNATSNTIINAGLRFLMWTNAPAAPSNDIYNNSVRLYFFSGQLKANPYQRANGYSIRCIRDTALETTVLERP